MKRAWSRALVASSSAVLLGSLLSASPASASSPEAVTINLVVTNDFHGYIDDHLLQWAGTVEQLLADAPDANTLFLGAGDNVGESTPASAAQQDNPAIDVLNLLGLDATATGNHEFDRGYDDLVNRIVPRADFPILGANVVRSDGTPALPASALFTVAGMRLAVIGVVTDTTPDLTPPGGIAGLTFGDPVAAINIEVDRLNNLPQTERPQVIVATIHDGAPWGTWRLDQAVSVSPLFDRLINETSPDVAAIITGHTHNTYVYDVSVPGEPGRTRPVIQSGYHGMHVGQVKLSVDPQTGEVTGYSARVVDRVSVPDAELIATYPVLAQVAQIRDDAEAFATAKTVAAQAARADYDAAVDEANAAYVAASDAKTRYETAVQASHDAYEVASEAKGRYDEAVAARQEAYAGASEAKGQYDAAVTDGRNAYERAAALRAQYDESVAAGREAYRTAVEIRDQYQAEVVNGEAARNTAAALKVQYGQEVAAGKDAHRTAAEIREQYQAEVVNGEAARNTAAALKIRYDQEVAAGNRAQSVAADLRDQYLAALANGESSVSPEVIELVAQFQEAVAARDDAYARASALVPQYQEAVAAGNDAYATATSLMPAYVAAVDALNAAHAIVVQLTPPCVAAVDALNAALATAAESKDALEAAVATLDSTLATVESTKQTLLSLL